MQVQAPSLPPAQKYHLFISYAWGGGKDQPRVIKQALCEMVASCSVFVDVDDLSQGRGAEYVDMSQNMLLMLTSEYFTSVNCLGELLRGVLLGVPLSGSLRSMRARLLAIPSSSRLTARSRLSMLHRSGTRSKIGSWGRYRRRNR